MSVARCIVDCMHGRPHRRPRPCRIPCRARPPQPPFFSHGMVPSVRPSSCLTGSMAHGAKALPVSARPSRVSAAARRLRCSLASPRTRGRARQDPPVKAQAAAPPSSCLLPCLVSAPHPQPGPALCVPCRPPRLRLMPSPPLPPLCHTQADGTSLLSDWPPMALAPCRPPVRYPPHLRPPQPYFLALRSRAALGGP